jgi:hypothetical protein
MIANMPTSVVTAKSENLLFAGLVRVLRQSKLRLKTDKTQRKTSAVLGAVLLSYIYKHNNNKFGTSL